MDKLNIIKIGGSIFEDDDMVSSFLDDFCRLEGPRVLVHGGGSQASSLSEKLGIKVSMKGGRRITDAASLEVAIMVYAGLINKTLVAKLQARSCNAAGLSGADFNIIPAKKRIQTVTDYGFVGDIESTNMNRYLIRRLMDENVVPVFCAITHDTSGQLLNTNADTIAASLAIALSSDYEVNLSYCMNIDGVLKNINNPDSLVESLEKHNYQKLKRDGAIKNGMLPKLCNGFEALENGVSRVMVKHIKNLLSEKGTSLAL